MKTLSVFCLLSFLVPLIGNSQVTGTVRSVIDNEAIAYASVYWQGSKVGVLTNEDGEFSISVPKTKSDSLKISYVGHKSYSLAFKDWKSNLTVLLEPSAQLEEVVVTQLTAKEIVTKAYQKQRENHFRNKTFQPGYSETLFYDNNNLFEVAQASYNVTHTVDRDKIPQQELVVNRMRAVVDSALFKSINDELNFKKHDTTFGPEGFLAIGQYMNFDRNDSSKKDKRQSSNYKLVDEINYQGEVAYSIEGTHFYKGKEFLNVKYYIEKETFAFLYKDFETNAQTDLNKLIVGAVRLVIRLAGFNFKIKSAKVVSYFKRNTTDPNIFDLEKGFSKIELDVKRTDRWIKGKVTQEFYLLPKQTLIEQLEHDYSNTIELMQNFDNEEYFEGTFHLPTRESTLKKVKQLELNNATYEGSLASDRYQKWEKKQEQKTERRRKRREIR